VLKYERLAWIRTVLERMISDDDIFAALFESCPELDNFEWEKSSDYDGKDFSEHVQILSVNGYSVDSDGAYYKEEDDVENDLPRVSEKVTSSIADAITSLSNWRWDYNVHTIHRKQCLYNYNYNKKKKDVESEVVLKIASGCKVKESLFKKDMAAEWALYYSVEHGRFKDEFGIWAHKGRMHCARRYAMEVVKGPLPAAVENFFILNDSQDSPDHADLKEYLEFKQSFEKSIA